MGCGASKVDVALQRIYNLKAEVGIGAEGVVYYGKAVTDNAKFALKTIPLLSKSSHRNIDRRNLLNEAQSLAWLAPGHVNIVQLEEVLLTERHVVLVMEWANGGTLASLSRDRQVSELEALYYFKQMVAAVDYCHQHHVAHRDLKLENMLLDTTSSPPRIKLVDFGLSKHWEPASNRLARMNTCAGTPGYISPEVAGTILSAPGSSYDGTKADVWALGVALVGLLLHHLPFAYSQLQHLSVRGMLRNMQHQQLNTRWLDAPPFRDHLAALSPALRHLLSAIFIPDATQRISMAAIRQHPWLRTPLPRRYQAALDVMAAEQVRRMQLAAAACGGTGDALTRQLRERLAVMQLQLQAGGVPPGSAMRVSFRDVWRPAARPQGVVGKGRAAEDAGRRRDQQAAHVQKQQKKGQLPLLPQQPHHLRQHVQQQQQQQKEKLLLQQQQQHAAGGGGDYVGRYR